MNARAIVAAAALLTACSAPQDRERRALMDQIEKQVQLPKDAQSLGEYARYYTDRGSEVIAVYLTPMDDEVRPGQSCEEVFENFTTLEVPCEPMAGGTIGAGERRWVNSEQDLPFIDDGGCGQITIIFDKAKSVVKSAQCNGVA